MNRIQQGTGPHVLVTVFCGLVASRLATILGPTVTVYSIAGSAETAAERAEMKLLRDAARHRGGEFWLAGFSAGGGTVRRLLDVLDPDGCIIADGGAISLPGRPQTMPRSQYERFVALAKAGKRRFIASHTYLTYVEQLPPAQGPYRSTVGTLEDVIGIVLPEPPKGVVSITKLLGVTILSYESGPADAPAHARQVQQALPRMVEEFLAPLLLGPAEGREAVATAWALASSAVSVMTSVAERVVDAVTGDAEPADLYLSHGWRCAVSELVADARAVKRWHESGDGYVAKVGDLVISKRSGQDPRTGGSGHVERITKTHPYGAHETIGGNESNTWIEDGLVANQILGVVGVIDVDPRIGARAVELSRAELAAGVAEKPGPAAHPRIQAYHAGARRPGGPLAGMPGHEGEGAAILGSKASDEIHWCASAASWAAAMAAHELS